MKRFLKSLMLLLCSGLFAATGWADITGVTPWACYQFNGSDANTGSGGKAWNGGSFTYTVTGATGDAASNVAVASGSRWTATGDFSVADGFTLSLVATEGSSLSSADNNGHLISMAQKGQSGYPRWWIRNSATSGTVKLQGLFTESLDVTHTENLTGFHHYVVRISADRTVVDVFVDGEQIDTSALTVNPDLDDAYHGYQVNNRWGGGSAANAKFDDLRMYTKALTNEQIKALYYAHFKFKHVLTFDGDGAEIDTWNANKGEKPSNSNLVSTPFGKGFVVANGVHPWSGYSVTKPFSIVMYANIASVALVTGDPATKKNAYLVACGNNGNHIALVKTAPDTVQLWKNGTCVEGLTITDPMLNGVGAYHLFAFGTDESGSFLQVDGQKVRGAAIAAPNGGFQIGSMYQGLSDTTTRVQGYGMIVDELYEYGAAFDNDALDALAAYFPATYPTLSMAADTNQDNVISKAELDAAVGAGVTKWNVSGEVVISLDADVDPALTALTLLPANASGDSLTITGAGSLYGGNFTLTTAIPVDITNQKNNPSITFSGAGDVTIRKGNGPTAGGIAPAMNNYTGTFTADDGQQITRMGGELTIPFTVGANGAKLHSNGNDWTVSSKISGSGTLTIASPSRWIAVTNNTNDFTGNVVVESGTLYVGNKGSENSGSDAQLGNGNSTYTVKSGATLYTHLGGNNKTFAPNITLEEGAIFGNRDGHVTYSGNIAINGAASYNFYWNKQNTFSGVVSGSGTLTINGPDNEDGTCEIRLTNANNTFTGTYKLAGKNDARKIKLVACATTAVPSYTLTNAYSILAFSGDATANGLTGTAGSVESDAAGTARTVTLTGNSDVRSLTVSNDITFAVTAGETYITSTTKATVASGAKVKVVLTADQKLSGLTLENVTVDGGTVVFLDADGTTVLQSANSNAYAGAQECTYTVAEEGGAWNKEPKDNDAITLAFGEITGRTLDTTILPDGVTRLAKITITGSNAMVAASLLACADTIESATAWSLVGGAEESVEVSSVISGAGQMKIASGKVTFPNAKTYTGGTDIAEGATLTISHANALSTSGTITGAGTLVCNAVRPANMTGLTTGTAASGETPASGWTGTVWLKNVTANASIKEFANANASLTLEGSKGHFTSFTVKTLTLMGDSFGFQPSDGSSGASTAHNVMTIGALKGDGSLLGPTKNGSDGAYCYAYVIGDMSEFTGTLDTTSYGGRTVVWCGEALQSVNYHDYDGKIVLAIDATIAANQTWSTVNGTVIQEGKTLTVNGALTGAIANDGALVYAVDTTASNTFTGAGFIFADGEGVELDLSAATLTDFGGAFNAVNGATIKLPYAATAGTTLSCDEDSTFVVVYSDAETEQDDLRAVTVTGTGTLQFVDEAGNALPSSGSTYVLPTYTVTAEGGSWNVTPLQNNKVVIDFGATAGSVNLTDEILGSVTTLSKLIIKGTNGGTITNSAVTACPIVEVLAGGRTNVPAALTNLATMVDGPTAEGSLLYVTGETTATTSSFPYMGNRHFETLKFTGQRTVGQGLNNYIVATGETIEFLHNDGACYEKSLVVDGGTIRTMQDTYVWLAGEEGATFTLKTGVADFFKATEDDGNKGLLIGYMGSTHTFDIQGGTLDVSKTSIVGYQPDSHYRQSGGLVKTKGYRQNGTSFTEMTLTGGTIELGSGGLPNLGMDNATFSGATIHAVANNTVAEALNMTGDAILSAAANTTMMVTSTFTGTATLSIAGAGTVDLSGATIPNTIALNVAAGATAVVAADQVSTFAKVIVPEGATLKVKLTVDCLISGRLNCTLGAESTLDGTIVLDGIEGETTTFTDGVLSVTFTANPTLIGNAWWWDYEFNGDVRSTGSDVAPLVLEGDGTSYVTVDGDNQALYFQKTPYRDNGNDVKARFAEVDTFTAVMYCQPGNHNNVPLVGFGSTTQNDKVAVVLATGAVAADGEMAIMLVKGDNHVVTPLADNLVVPNATKAYHLYAFTFDAQADKTVISVYVDGKLKKTTTVNEHFRVSNGFQIGSIHGGVMTNQTGLSKYPDSGDSGTIDFLRVTKGLLSADAMRALAEAYPYHSENGTATRTVTDTTANWVAESTWTQSGEDAPVNQPNNGTNVTLTANVATEVTVNLTEAVTYETVTVAGNAAVTFKKGGTATFKAGDITIGTDVTIEYGAINVGTLIVNGGKTLTFDFTDYDFNSIYASKTLPLTGLATLGENATVTVELPTLPAYLTAECVFDASKSEYALAITVTGTLAATIENNAIIWKVGEETVVTPPADLTALDSITMTVVGDNSVTLTEDMTLASVVLTGEGEGNAVTFESGKLTVNNTLTMNNVNVMATPDTLAAAVVMGTAGTESFTMHSRASYSHENKFAMRFENCALTKAGAGTFPIASSGFVLDRVNVTLKNGALQLSIGSGADPKIKDTTFTYVDENEDGVADGQLTNYGWVHSTTTTTFVVPKGVTGKALVGSCLTDTGAVVKQGAGTLELGVMKTANANPYTGATTIEAGTLVYDVTNNSANPFVMSSVITVAEGAAIKGVENCTLASLIFEAGAIVDATDAPVTATTVTLPETGTVKVRKTTHGDVLLTTGLDDVTKFAVEGEGRANWSLVVKENGLVYVAAPATGDVEFSAEVQDMLNAMAQAAAEYEGITSLTIEGVTLAMDGEGNPVKADIAGLELFERVPVLVVPDGENGTGVAMVNYVFGISDITVNGDGYIVVKASVDCLAMDNPVEPIEGEDAGEGEGEMPELQRPTFVDGVTVALYNGEAEIGTAEVDAAGSSEITITSTDDLVTIFEHGTGTLDLTVKVKSAQASETPEGGEGDETEVTSAE